MAQAAKVTLEPITWDTLQPVLKLEVGTDQRAYVASNATSIAEAYFNPGAWFRAIHADGAPVGFVMLFNQNNPGAGAAMEEMRNRIKGARLEVIPECLHQTPIEAPDAFNRIVDGFLNRLS